MSGKVYKMMRRSARKYVNTNLSQTCHMFFNSMCRLPFKRRLALAARIVFKRPLPPQPGEKVPMDATNWAGVRE